MTDTIKCWECPECGIAGDALVCVGFPPRTHPIVKRVERVYVAVDALLSDSTVNAAAADTGHLAQCGVEEYGGCGGTHASCYWRSKLLAAVNAVKSLPVSMPGEHITNEARYPG